MIFLAQSFPDPPLTEQWLFVNPWPGIIVLIVVAALLRLIAQRAGKTQLNWGVPAALLLAGGLYALTALVDTQREQVDNAMRTLLQATIEKDLAALSTLISDDATISDADGNPWGRVGPLRDELDTALTNFTIESHRVNDLRVQPTGERGAQVLLDLRTTFAASGFPNATRWVFTWERVGDGKAWRVTDARWLKWQGRKPPGPAWR